MIFPSSARQVCLFYGAVAKDVGGRSISLDLGRPRVLDGAEISIIHRQRM